MLRSATIPAQQCALLGCCSPVSWSSARAAGPLCLALPPAVSVTQAASRRQEAASTREAEAWAALLALEALPGAGLSAPTSAAEMQTAANTTRVFRPGETNRADLAGWLRRVARTASAREAMLTVSAAPHPHAVIPLVPRRAFVDARPATCARKGKSASPATAFRHHVRTTAIARSISCVSGEAAVAAPATRTTVAAPTA